MNDLHEWNVCVCVYVLYLCMNIIQSIYVCMYMYTYMYVCVSDFLRVTSECLLLILCRPESAAPTSSERNRCAQAFTCGTSAATNCRTSGCSLLSIPRPCRPRLSSEALGGCAAACTIGVSAAISCCANLLSPLRLRRSWRPDHGFSAKPPPSCSTKHFHVEKIKSVQLSSIILQRTIASYNC